MLARTLPLIAATSALAAVAAPAASADTRTFESRITVIHDRQSGDGRAEVRIVTGPVRQVVVTRPVIQFLAGGGTADRWPARLTGPGCEPRRTRAVVHLATEGRAFKPGFSQVVVSSGGVPGLNGFCGTAKGYERGIVPKTAIDGAPRVLRSMGVGATRTLRGTDRTGRCPDDCATTRVTLTLKRVA